VVTRNRWPNVLMLIRALLCDKQIIALRRGDKFIRLCLPFGGVVKPC